MSQEFAKIVEGTESVLFSQRLYFACIGSDNCSRTKLWNGLGSANVSVGNIAAADESHIQHLSYDRAPASCNSFFMPAQLWRVDSSGVLAPRQ